VARHGRAAPRTPPRRDLAAERGEAVAQVGEPGRPGCAGSNPVPSSVTLKSSRRRRSTGDVHLVGSAVLGGVLDRLEAREVHGGLDGGVVPVRQWCLDVTSIGRLAPRTGGGREPAPSSTDGRSPWPSSRSDRIASSISSHIDRSTHAVSSVVVAPAARRSAMPRRIFRAIRRAWAPSWMSRSSSRRASSWACTSRSPARRRARTCSSRSAVSWALRSTTPIVAAASSTSDAGARREIGGRAGEHPDVTRAISPSCATGTAHSARRGRSAGLWRAPGRRPARSSRSRSARRRCRGPAARRPRRARRRSDDAERNRSAMPVEHLVRVAIVPVEQPVDPARTRRRRRVERHGDHADRDQGEQARCRARVRPGARHPTTIARYVAP
jgi:hypothetical protein